MCLHGCIIFFSNYSACYGNYKADRDPVRRPEQCQRTVFEGVHLNLADALADNCKNAAEDAAKVGLLCAGTGETTNQDRNKDEATAHTLPEIPRQKCQTAEHRVRAGSLEDTVSNSRG